MNENEEIAYENGRDEGYNDGYSDGYKVGYADGLENSVIWAKWIYRGLVKYECSNCGYEADKAQGHTLTPFCPQCGAKIMSTK